MQRPRLRLRGWVLAVVLCVACPATAQESTPAPAASSATPIADAVERIARELWPASLPDQVQSEGSTFRLNIRAPEVALQKPWLDDDPPPTRRPVGGSIYHEEMLAHLAPEEFRASTLNTVGVGIDPAVIVNGIRGVWRDWQVRRIRAQIARELAELEAANAAVADR